MGTKKIDALAELLERTGGDAERLEVVRRTQRFKRSWIDLAEALAKVRSSQAFTRWGYSDFYKYCAEELTLKRPTVDKLLLSFHTIRSHAPEVLEWDGVAQVIPSYEAVDYFSRAVGEFDSRPLGARGDGVGPGEAAKGDPGDPGEGDGNVLHEVRHAVFDEGKPLAELRKRFDPVLYPRPKGAAKLDLITKASAAARRLAELLPDIDGLDPRRVQKLEVEIGALRQELDALGAPLKESVKQQRAKTKAAAKARTSGVLQDADADADPEADFDAEIEADFDAEVEADFDAEVGGEADGDTTTATGTKKQKEKQKEKEKKKQKPPRLHVAPTV